ncbi:hypothetical protein GJU40_19115 [Bacillus lacus]|uniref:Uncharacterized protein n=1 Tax=Metabacillus lacus TaxID=1983721 RepID=A0A7X2J2F6_9BACI|nr:hypothetical protein [Metabacillus lacus]MRX74236.1 hypothetical protein [Metabacillus lacus]
MKMEILQIKELYKQLITILNKESDNEVNDLIKQLAMGLTLIDECFYNHPEETNLNQLYLQLTEIYKNINQPRVGLSDYFIWRDDYGERIKANECLDFIKASLHKVFIDHEFNEYEKRVKK